MKADLHTHSNFSDGVNDPSENVRIAKEIGLKALGITDHDSVLGVVEAIETGEKIGMEIVPGIELSTLHSGQEIHILGYFINYKDKIFLDKLNELQKKRKIRNEMMIAKLNELGIDISMSDVVAKIRRSETNIGRPHIGEVLIDKGVVKTMNQAFKIYLGRHGKAYVNAIRITPEQGIDIIKDAGGVPVIAHPGIYGNDKLVVSLVEYGLEGIEVYHPDHNKNDKCKYQKLANTYKVLATGGSDFHGVRKGETFHSPIGSNSVSYDVVQKLKELSLNS
ncbi:MAG: PHP domain-containing protein [Vulcanibacillus sp.]